MFILFAILAILVFLVSGGIGFPISALLLLIGVLANGRSETEA